MKHRSTRNHCNLKLYGDSSRTSLGYWVEVGGLLSWKEGSTDVAVAVSQDFGKSYKDAAEKEMRFKAFSENYEYILAENVKFSSGHAYKLGLNDFSDITPEEFEKKLGMRLRPKTLWRGPKKGTHKVRNISLSGSVDWRTKGVVTPVKNQQLDAAEIFCFLWWYTTEKTLTTSRAFITNHLDVHRVVNHNPYLPYLPYHQYHPWI